jgi:inward rectifier potassium channel
MRGIGRNEFWKRRFGQAESKGDEFGFTSRAAENAKRVINKDGSFNVVRVGQKFSGFHALVTMPWPAFFGIVTTMYLTVNLLFAGAYLLVDFDGIGMTADYEVRDRFLVAFFFSAQTLTTVGYGSLYPLSATVSAMAAVEALTGLMGFALFTGLMYSRFSRPQPGIRFSRSLLYAPHKEGHAIMFRAANERSSNLTGLEVRVLMSLVVDDNGRPTRRYQALKVENSRITYFPLNWTIVHPVDAESPLQGLTREDLEALEVEFMVMISGYNETAAQAINARTSYTAREMVWNARFKLPYHFREDGVTVFELDKLDDHEIVGPAPEAPAG